MPSPTSTFSPSSAAPDVFPGEEAAFSSQSHCQNRRACRGIVELPLNGCQDRVRHIRDVALPANSRSLAYNVRLNSTERTLKDSEVSVAREQLISVAASLGATLR